MINSIVKKKYDIVIVGGGINGLLIAASLSLKFKNILLVEKSEFLGGMCRMIDDEFFVGAHHIAGLNNQSFVSEFLKKIGISVNNDFIHVKYIKLFHNGDIKKVPIIIDELIDYLKDNYPKESESIDKLFEKIKLYTSYFLNADEKGLRKMFIETSSMTFETFLKKYSLSNELCQLLTMLSPGYGGIGIKGIAFNNLSLLISYGIGSGYVKGKNNKLINYLKDFSQNNGVNFLSNCNCIKCNLVDNSTVSLVCSMGGKKIEIFTENTILCCYPFEILKETISETRIEKKLQNFHPGASVFRLYATLNADISSLKGDVVYMGNYNIENMDNNILLSPKSTKLPICMIYSDNSKIMFTFLVSPEDKNEVIVDDLVKLIEKEIPILSNVMTNIFTIQANDYKKITNTKWGSVFGWERDTFTFMNSNIYSPELQGIRGIYISGNWGTDYGIYGAIRTADKVCKRVNINKREIE